MTQFKGGSILPWQAVYTGFQLAGKGQRGNSWVSEKDKNLLFSCFIPFKILASEQFVVTAKVAMALLKIVSHILNNDKRVSIKWPNDIMIDNKKLAGILVEAIIKGRHSEGFVVGIGLNINQQDNLPPNAESLINIIGQKIEISPMVEHLVESLKHEFSNEIFDKNHYLRNLFGFNQMLLFRDSKEEFIGKIIDVTEQGKLIIEAKDMKKEYDLKEIQFIVKSKKG